MEPLSAGKTVSPPVDAKSRATSRLAFSAALLGLLGTLAFGLALVMPWYSVSYASTGEITDYSYNEQRDYYTYGKSVQIEERYASHPMQTIEQFNGWRANSDRLPLPLYDEVREILFLGLASSAALVAGALYLPRGKARYLILAPCVLMLIAGAAAPLHHQSENPDAMEEDSFLRTGGSGSPRQTYFGQNEFGGLHETWGPAGGWYLSLAGAALGAAASALVLLQRRSPVGGRPGPRTSFAALAVALIVAGASLGYPYAMAGQHESAREADAYLSSEFGDPVTYPVFRSMRAEDGDWVLACKGGGSVVSSFTYLRIQEANTSNVLLDARLTAGTATNPDFQYLDGGRNGWLDHRDYIIIHATGNGQPNPHVVDGARVALIKGGQHLTSSRLMLANPESFLEIRKLQDGNWSISNYFLSASSITETRFEIIDPINNTTTFSSFLGSPEPGVFVFHDNDRDLRFGNADSILLYSTYMGGPGLTPRARAGFIIKFYIGNELLAEPMAVPG